MKKYIGFQILYISVSDCKNNLHGQPIIFKSMLYFSLKKHCCYSPSYYCNFNYLANVDEKCEYDLHKQFDIEIILIDGKALQILDIHGLCTEA